MRLGPLLLFCLLGACRTAGAVEPRPAQPRELAVGFLIVDGVYNTELIAPYDVFQHTLFHAQPGMRVFTVAPTAAPVKSFEGLRIVPDYTLASAPPIDVLVVPSAEHSMDSDLENAALIAWVQARGEHARFVLSLCDGAFVLAKAGLLDGHAATTFPADVARFRELFARTVDVREGVSFVHDGPRITSVGGAKSYDAALYLCELLYGAEAARGIGRGLVIDWDARAVAHVVAR
ncbi:MAG: DJ-1/PfpI family protein [Planctomycetes bacterium]|nr:DJ-1/PfpI family protein [Planctomycetota bacterium]